MRGLGKVQSMELGMGQVSALGAARRSGRMRGLEKVPSLELGVVRVSGLEKVPSLELGVVRASAPEAARMSEGLLSEEAPERQYPRRHSCPPRPGPSPSANVSGRSR